jgi:hypothetical protein
LPCPAGRSVLVAEDPSAEGVRDPTRPEELPRRIRGLAHETVVTEDGPYPLDELGAVASTCEVVFHRPCHPRARSSGHERYQADSHGHSQRVAERAAHS